MLCGRAGPVRTPSQNPRRWQSAPAGPAMCICRCRPATWKMPCLSGAFERHHGIGGSRVAHEPPGIRRKIALLVQGISEPAAVGLFLIAPQPVESAPHRRIGRLHARLLQNESDHAGGVTIALRLKRSIVFSLPRTDKLRKTEPAIVALRGKRFLHDGGTLGGGQ